MDLTDLTNALLLRFTTEQIRALHYSTKTVMDILEGVKASVPGIDHTLPDGVKLEDIEALKHAAEFALGI